MVVVALRVAVGSYQNLHPRVVPLPVSFALHYLLSGIHFGAMIWKSALCVRDAQCTLAEELEIGTSRRSLGSLQGGLRREQ